MRRERDAVGAARDARRLDDVRRLARWLDAAFVIPGTGIRVGLDPLLGLLPGLGDLAGSLLGAWIVVVAHRLGAPPAVLVRMGLNLAIDSVVGAVPVLGDLFDVAWRANLRNAALLDAWSAAPARAGRSSALVVAGVLAAVLAVTAAVVFAGWHVVAWATGEMHSR
ncbi:DUF4112 domain-containing protein [Anaeromyxobacter oryzae]|uniref:DUF4112 domain-containing protein n=1 Tax=Anaeromyxobacter oryzae TaxID=2918170 RepID=A0ABN6MY44_9BACT|nr:DUF4112 domain-containing protein [Anaeromyxobacter oryzae]BDG04653.1 hypothetical protein AMOR_36490 [Anaeromyxobacter oryzae]